MSTDTDSEQPTPISAELTELYAYLSDRAIPTNHNYMLANGLEFAGGERISQLLGAAYPKQKGIAIHYPDTDYATVRLVPGGPRCPKGRLPHAYLPTAIDWPTINGTLVICESPLKALTWASAGHNALSAGGVTTIYMARKEQWCAGFPHAAIDSGAINTILIAWDSDIEANHDVAGALRVLSRALAERHSDVRVLIHTLPPPPENDPQKRAVWGCDDARAYWGDDWFRAWSEDERFQVRPAQDRMQDHFDQLDSEYTVVLSENKIVSLKTGNWHAVGDFRTLVEGHRSVPGEKKPIKVAPLWVEREDRPTCQAVTYAPGQEIVACGNYNVWRPSELIPRAGDASLWLDLLTDAVRDDETRRLMLDCMAYQVQNRGMRLQKLLYFVGREVGTGKSTQAYIMRQILGSSNTGWITRTEMEGNYNACWAAKELVVLDDIAKLKRDTWGVIKTHITSESATITEKYMTARQQSNHAVFYITSNQADILTTDTEDRRVLMIPFAPTVLHRGDDDAYWPKFYSWLDNGGLEAIAHYLGTRDLSAFNPHFYPPYSEIKEAAIEGTRSEEELFLRDFREHPENYVLDGRICITGAELYMIHSGMAPGPYNAQERHLITRIASVVEQFPRACKGQFQSGGTRSTLYWIPGRVPELAGEDKEYGARQVARRNIKKFPITLQ